MNQPVILDCDNSWDGEMSAEVGEGMHTFRIHWWATLQY